MSTQTADRMVDVTLELIAEHGGCRGVNLRQVARRVGCAHTNVYNYFSAFDELLWAAMLRALERMSQFTAARLAAPPADAGRLEAFVTSQVDFAMEHPGWYRFIWLEALPDPPPEVARSLQQSAGQYLAALFAGGPEDLDLPRKEHVAYVVHGYLHGEICKLIQNRFVFLDSQTHRRRIIANALSLFALLAGPTSHS